MSTFKVEVVQINGVVPHPGADRLDLICVKDWQCVSTKGNFNQGDLAIYFPIDSLLPSEVESKIFGPDSKVKLNGSRVRTIKLRGAISQGLIIKPEVLNISDYKLGSDLTNKLGVIKYEPPVKLTTGVLGAQATKKQTNPNFRKYTGIENAKNYPSIFEVNEDIVVTEKIHGTNFRAGRVPFFANSLFKRFKQWLGLAPKYEFVYGSHNIQLQSRLLHKSYYGSALGNVYAEAVKNYDLEKILMPGEVVYGEIYGDGIQKGYTYGCKSGERKLILFDVMIDGEYLNPIEFKKWGEARQLPTVPVLYTGPFNKEKVLQLRDGDSILSKSQKIREGVVVKPIIESKSYIGRKVLKYISDNYLLKNQDNEDVAH